MACSEHYRKLLGEWLELADHPNNGGCDVVDGIKYRAFFGERYRRGEGTPHLHIGFKNSLGNTNSHGFCAEFYRMGHQGNGGRVRDWYHQTVLVDGAEVIEQSQQESIDSIVWLKPINDCPVVGMNLGKRIITGAREVFRVGDDGKSHAPGFLMFPPVFHSASCHIRWSSADRRFWRISPTISAMYSK
jgi:hypothetical protein